MREKTFDREVANKKLLVWEQKNTTMEGLKISECAHFMICRVGRVTRNRS